jgi:hypothetical protein
MCTSKKTNPRNSRSSLHIADDIVVSTKYPKFISLELW